MYIVEFIEPINTHKFYVNDVQPFFVSLTRRRPQSNYISAEQEKIVSR